jgi:small-conductance mechanosensitive channel
VFILGLAYTATAQTASPLPQMPAEALRPAPVVGNDVSARSLAPGLRLVGPNQAVEILGVKFVGVNAENGRKLLLTLAYIAVVLLLGRGARAVVRRVLHERRDERVAFWARQGVRLGTAVLLTLGFVSIWFDDPTRLATALGLVTAGLAFALQKVVTAIAGYFVILRGKTFNVGDRITMGGVRGDVIALGFIQTTIMEMGQPPAIESGTDPAMWVHSRQYTGRIVTVSNAKIFDEPVYNYTRDFPYIWEEMRLPVAYKADRERAERILLEVAERHAVPVGALSHDALEEMQRRYVIKAAEIRPRVYYRLTDNWLQLTVRFIAEESGVRDLKDAMSRDILKALDEAGIGLASPTFEIVGLPPLRLQGAVPAGLETPGG